MKQNKPQKKGSGTAGDSERTQLIQVACFVNPIRERS